jgi:hypothetical protein
MKTINGKSRTIAERQLRQVGKLSLEEQAYIAARIIERLKDAVSRSGSERSFIADEALEMFEYLTDI